MRVRIGWGLLLCPLLAWAGAAFAQPATGQHMTPAQELGRQIFFDGSLSEPAGQSCASCHAPQAAFASPGGAILEGTVTGRFGNRTPPTIAYAADFKMAFAEPLDCKTNGVQRILQALSAYEGGPEVNPFSSKYDGALAGKVQLTAQEVRGYQLFQGEAKCEKCHPSSPGPRGEPPLFTDFGYDNIGAPKNPKNPFYAQPKDFNPDGAAYIDGGLGAFLKKPAEYGKFRSPSLRNITVNEETRAYMHNGSLIGLKEVLAFYNKRDAEPGRWAPEVAATVNKDDLGDLKLSDQDIEDLLAFLRTLTDGYKPSVTTAR